MRFISLTVYCFLVTACAQGLPELPSAQQSGQIEPDAGDAETFIRMGDRLRGQGQVAAASTMYKRAISYAPNDSTPYAKLGDLAWQSGQLQAASDLYAQALQRDQSDPIALLGRARALALTDERDAALLLVDDLIKAQGPTTGAISLKALLFDLNGQFEDAQSLHSAALNANPGNINLTASLAYSFALSGNYKNAVNLLRPLGENQRTAAAAQAALADVYAMSGQGDAAIALKASALGVEDLPAADAYFLTKLGELEATQQARAVYFRQLPTSSSQPQKTITRRDSQPVTTQQEAQASPEPDVSVIEARRDVARDTPSAPSAVSLPQSAEQPTQFWVQMASFQSKEALEMGWYNIRRAHPAIAQRLAPAVETISLPEKGIFHRLYAGGYATESQATNVCDALRQDDLSCVIIVGDRPTVSLAELLSGQ